MWTVIKFDKKKLETLKSQLKEKFGNNFELYCPKISIDQFRNNKLVKKQINLLGDYMFCFNKSFSNTQSANKIKYIKGIKYLVNGFLHSQTDIIEFISKCKKMENKEGVITQGLFEMEINKIYKFSSGTFTQQIFKIIELQRNKIKILMGKIETTIDKRDYLFSPL